MMTGRHLVRDVFCKRCNTKLGWMYEFAVEPDQKYKEGRVILERRLVRESEEFDDSLAERYDTETSSELPVLQYCLWATSVYNTAHRKGIARAVISGAMSFTQHSLHLTAVCCDDHSQNPN
ncbi:Protein yippee-like 5 [Toxocara canis]|uniref:Protein yippee-like n=1 Tax=Toxocara canis TaxID=6265 RepID=A0A0B2UP46_TOXCA|nr:Protein yippee-like 5 [Toxocara canis]